MHDDSNYERLLTKRLLFVLAEVSKNQLYEFCPCKSKITTRINIPPTKLMVKHELETLRRSANCDLREGMSGTSKNQACYSTLPLLMKLFVVSIKIFLDILKGIGTVKTIAAKLLQCKSEVNHKLVEIWYEYFCHFCGLFQYL